MTSVVIDASAGVEIFANTTHGRRLVRLLSGWRFRHNVTMADAAHSPAGRLATPLATLRSNTGQH